MLDTLSKLSVILCLILLSIIAFSLLKNSSIPIPIGRYQPVPPVTDGTVFIVDTATGKLYMERNH